MKKLLIACVAVLGLGLAACNDANVASSNLSTAADNFEINRRVVFYNGITGEYMLSIEGLAPSAMPRLARMRCTSSASSATTSSRSISWACQTTSRSL
jgi:predicted small secreted protein